MLKITSCNKNLLFKSWESEQTCIIYILMLIVREGVFFAFQILLK